MILMNDIKLEIILFYKNSDNFNKSMNKIN